MDDKKDLKAELRGFAERIRSMSDDELDEIVGGIGGYQGDDENSRIDLFIEMMNEHIRAHWGHMS